MYSSIPPGIHLPKDSLGDYMVNTANSTMHDADAVVLVVDAGKPATSVEENVIRYLKESGVPGILVLNKIDLYGREQIAETIALYAAKHTFAAVVPICAKNNRYVNEVLDECKPFLSESEWYYDDDIVTDQPERQMAAEIIREKLLRTLNKEVPHGIAVMIEDSKKREASYVSTRSFTARKNPIRGSSSAKTVRSSRWSAVTPARIWRNYSAPKYI